MDTARCDDCDGAFRKFAIEWRERNAFSGDGHKPQTKRLEAGLVPPRIVPAQAALNGIILIPSQFPQHVEQIFVVRLIRYVVNVFVSEFTFLIDDEKRAL